MQNVRGIATVRATDNTTMSRRALAKEAKLAVADAACITRYQRILYRRAIRDITAEAVAAWPTAPGEAWSREEGGIRQRLRARGYSSVWLLILSSLVSLIFQLLLDRFQQADGSVMLVNKE